MDNGAVLPLEGRATRPDIHNGICGEYGGEPTSVELCHRVGLDYVSCSPFRVPIARLAAAQAAIKESLNQGSAASQPQYRQLLKKSQMIV